MSKVINVLAAMASNPSLVSDAEITALLTNADISNEQKKAILAQDSERLADTIADFPISMCAVISPADEDGQESQEETNNDEAKNILKYAING